MKKLYTLSLILIAGISSYAQTITFNGSGLLTANGWVETGTPTAPATSFPGPLAIVETASDSGNSLSYAGLPASTGNRTSTVHNNTQDANFAVTSLTGVAYYSALIKVPSTTGMFANTTSGEYFLHFASTAGTSSTAFVGRVYIKKGSTDNNFVLGALNNSGGTATPTYTTAEYNVNQTYFIALKYDFATNTSSLFVNATPGAAEPAPSATNATGTGTAPAQIAAICIRQSGGVTAAASTGTVEIDEIRVGGNWAAVAPSSLGIKENAIAGLKVFPNPVKNGNLYITSDNNASKSVVVFDVLGKQVINTTVSNQPINVSNLNAGVYIVKITEAGKIATRKLVIE